SAARIAYVSTGIEGGWLYEFNLDSLQITRRAPSLYVYETVLDPAARLLWGARPITGEVIAIDPRSLEIRQRIAVEPTIRDITIDPQSGDLFTCSFLSGNVFRVDRRTERATQIGWCGRLCRNLYFDVPRNVLWVATGDGVCRIALSNAIGAREAEATAILAR